MLGIRSRILTIMNGYWRINHAGVWGLACGDGCLQSHALVGCLDWPGLPVSAWLARSYLLTHDPVHLWVVWTGRICLYGIGTLAPSIIMSL
jgi:hypothetical protein